VIFESMGSGLRVVAFSRGGDERSAGWGGKLTSSKLMRNEGAERENMIRLTKRFEVVGAE